MEVHLQPYVNYALLLISYRNIHYSV